MTVKLKLVAAIAPALAMAPPALAQSTCDILAQNLRQDVLGYGGSWVTTV